MMYIFIYTRSHFYRRVAIGGLTCHAELVAVVGTEATGTPCDGSTWVLDRFLGRDFVAVR